MIVFNFRLAVESFGDGTMRTLQRVADNASSNTQQQSKVLDLQDLELQVEQAHLELQHEHARCQRLRKELKNLKLGKNHHPMLLGQNQSFEEHRTPSHMSEGVLECPVAKPHSSRECHKCTIC
eukprot:GGOE01024014.1.p2 GENE.GGOE01024014.1~~GGOE01024014.1.p2  ORF type:complete len:123 (-),score=5.36 GGOE01024014.1:493-861(-)